MRARINFLAIAMVLALWWLAPPAAAHQGFKVKLRPNLVNIGIFFGGAKVALKGSVPAGSQVAVVLEGPPQDNHFKRKRHVMGLLWMNQGEVLFRHVPSVYLVYTSQGVSPELARKLGFGYRAVRHRADIQPKEGEEEFLFSQFVKLKEEHGLYHWQQGGVRLGKPNQGRRPFVVKLDISSRMPPGEYAVRVLAVDQSHILASDLEHLKVQETGLLAQLANLSQNHGLLYGILSVLVAIGAGLLMDLIFGTKKSLH